MDSIVVSLDTSDPRQKEIHEWSLQNTAQVAKVYCLGYTVFNSGLHDYFKGFHKVDEWKLNELQGLLADMKRKVDEAEVAVDDRVVKRVKHETLSLASECEFLKRQLEQKEVELRHYIEKSETTVEEKTRQEATRLELSWSARLQIAEQHLCLLQEEKAEWNQRLRAMQEAKDAEVAVFRSKWEEVTHEVCRLSEGHSIAEISQLKEQLKLKDNEIHVLKSGNFVKGRAGENLISEQLQEHFTDWMIEYKGKSPHECDMHMVSAKGDIVMVESKNKDAIAKTDVDKFYNDIAYMEASERPCIGALFVSIRTRNIPWKGQVCLEIVNHKPVLFLGFGSEDDLQLNLANYVRVFLQYCHIVKQQSSDVNTDMMFAMMNSHFQSLLQTKIQIDRLKTQQVDMGKTVVELEKVHQKSVSSIETFLKQHNRLEITAAMGSGKNIYRCETCTDVFTNKKLFEKHAKACVC